MALLLTRQEMSLYVMVPTMILLCCENEKSGAPGSCHEMSLFVMVPYVILLNCENRKSEAERKTVSGFFIWR